MAALNTLEVRQLVANEPVHPTDPAGAAGGLSRLCRVSTRTLSVSGVGISVMTEQGIGGVAAASSPRSWQLEELQFSLGEGPCQDAFGKGSPVLVPDISDTRVARWPAYSPAAYGTGIRAVFAFPMHVGAARVGVLDLYRDEVGDLAAPTLASALSFTDVAMETLLEAQQDLPVGSLDPTLDAALEYRLELYQAQGMVMVQLGVPISEAVARIRAHAYAAERPLSDVARDIVARKLTLHRDDDYDSSE